MKTTAFYTKRGRLTRYGLACGYIERKRIGQVETTLWMEHGCLHVRQHDFGASQRVFWDSFDKDLTKARRRFTNA